MSQHPQHPQQRQHYPQGKKKVEWSSTLSSSEPPPTEDNSPVWDSEADHMLSYFLDGNALASPPRPMGAAMPGRGNLPGLSDRILQHPFRTDNFPQQRSMAMRQDHHPQPHLGLQHHQHNSDNDLRQPPPTPVIQHYFHAPTSSSSRKLSPKPNSGSSAAATTGQPQQAQLASGTQQPLHQFPFHQPPLQQPLQPQQPLQQPQPQIPLDPVQAMKHNFMGAYQQPFPAGTATTTASTTATTTSTKNPYAFAGYNPAMEDAMSPTISPALDFGGNPEPLLLPGKGGVVQATVPKPAAGAPTAAAAAATNHHFVPQIHALTAGAYQQQQQQQHPGDLNKGQATQVLSSQPTAPLSSQHISQAHVVAAQKQFAQSIPSSDAASHPVVTSSSGPGGFPQTVIPGSIHPAAFFFPHHLTTAFLMQKAESAEETEEKRAKRLERNRESARKSRRRKKERLSNLEEKVNKLYAKIETERRRQIHSMETAWKALGQDELLKLQQELQEEQEQPPNLERFWMGETEESIRKEVVEFQYNSLGQHLLPRYQKYFLWMILQEESYFLSGKEEHAKREFSKKITTGKISSKQLGEEISNGPKPPSWQRKSDTATNPPPASSPHNQDQTTAHVGESEKFWPLVCFELSISVEQEERFLEAQARFRHAESLHKNVSQIVAATRLASSAKECVLYQIYLAAFRKRKTYQSILTPKQAILYKQWLLSNRDRVETLVSNRRRKRRSSVAKGVFKAQGPFLDVHRDEDLTLEQLCRYLEESLKISKNLPDSIPEMEVAARDDVA